MIARRETTIIYTDEMRDMQNASHRRELVRSESLNYSLRLPRLLRGFSVNAAPRSPRDRRTPAISSTIDFYELPIGNEQIIIPPFLGASRGSISSRAYITARGNYHGSCTEKYPAPAFLDFARLAKREEKECSLLGVPMFRRA